MTLNRLLLICAQKEGLVNDVHASPALSITQKLTETFFLTNALLVSLKINTPVIYRSATVHSRIRITEKEKQ